MLKAVFLFSKTADSEAVDQYIETYVVPPIRASPGFRDLTMNEGPLMSPMGPPPYYKVVEATLASLDDFVAIGRSDIIERSQPFTPEGTLIMMYEVED